MLEVGAVLRRDCGREFVVVAQDAGWWLVRPQDHDGQVRRLGAAELARYTVVSQPPAATYNVEQHAADLACADAQRSGWQALADKHAADLAAAHAVVHDEQ